MINWELTQKGYDPENNSFIGNKFFIGNGYMGVRGTIDEAEKNMLPAVNLAGIYDRAGSAWREPLNAPNVFYACMSVDDMPLKLPDVMPEEHSISLDYRYGIFTRKSEWTTRRGNIRIQTERFVSMEDVHCGGIRYTVTADFHADVKLTLGIDGDVWDINGPHYDRLTLSEDGLGINAVSHEMQHRVAVAARYKTYFPCAEGVYSKDKLNGTIVNFITDIDKDYVIEKVFAIYTSKDCENPDSCAKMAAEQCNQKGFEKMLDEHRTRWDALWKYSEIDIEGDDEAMEALNYSGYHLHSIAPTHSESLSIPARGLSGQTYKGAVFWDTEMFMLDFYLMTQPKVARSLIMYRIDSLGGAMRKAKAYGYEGAFYPWESQEDGYDACSDYNVTDVFTKRPMRTYFKDKQIYISAAVVYGISKYVDVTNDTSVLSQGGAEAIIECALFYYSALVKRVNTEKYELWDVIGPDEYHERVNNNGYTNRMALYTFNQALKLIEGKYRLNADAVASLDMEYDLTSLASQFREAADKIYIPEPDEDGIIPQFDGYRELEDTTVDTVRGRLLDPKEYWGGAYGVASHTQIIKQADVITWLAMFPEDYDMQVCTNNWKYYEPRTEHGSSLSACMYSLTACRCGMEEKAMSMLMKSATADMQPGGKEWAGLVYIGGTHPAAHGGAYKVAIEGFAGISFEQDRIKAAPRLPQKWKAMHFALSFQGRHYKVSIKDNIADIRKL